MTDSWEQGDRPLFSVCIPAYEDVGAFLRCLDSVCAQTLVNIEIIVSDDSRTEGIERAVATWSDTRIRYRRNIPPLGAPTNWNAALRMSRGNRVTLLHQDDWYRNPNALAEINGRMDEYTADVLISGRALYGENGCMGEYRLSTDAAKHFLSGFPSASLVANRLGHPSVFFFSRQHLDIGYDERLLYFSDTDYYYRLLNTVKTVTVYREPVVGISWQRDSQLSNAYITSPQKALTELFLLHKKYSFTPFEQGTSAARLCTAQARHWCQFPGTVLKTLRNGLAPAAFVSVCVSMPFFLSFMIYRLLYRLVNQKKWA